MNWKNIVEESVLPKMYNIDYKHLYQDYLLQRFKGVDRPCRVYKQVDDIKMSINKRG